ncbi:MAG: hypothetical protein NTY77_12490 [Elusimicrobia bacterium]|nr:hypothetical protein [Elusimicrobiota bacterium]
MPSGPKPPVRKAGLALALALLAGLAPAARLAAAGSLASSRPDDLWPQAGPFPDAAKIRTVWQGNGQTEVAGRAGAVPGRFPVLVVSANSGAAAITSSGADGSFAARLVALPGSWVIVKYDPTAASSTQAHWLPAPSANQVLGDAMFKGNTAPGTWLRVAPEAPAPGQGVPFDVSGTAGPGGVDFSLTGAMTGTFEPGGSVRVEGTASLFPAAASAAALTGTRLRFDADLGLLFDQRGRARVGTGYYFSNILTPTGLPVQTKGRGTFSAPDLSSEPLAEGPGGRLSAAVRWTLPLPAGLPPGTYALWIRARAVDGRAAPLGGDRPGRQLVLTRDLSCLPPFAVGQPAPPRLTWTLLTDVPGADGSRGTVAEEDRGDFELASNVVTQSHAYIVPRVSKRNGQPLTYRLEPYLPMVAQGDRLVPNPPPIPFRFPSGRLTVRVRRPDGRTETLGPAPFTAARSRAPATSRGIPLNGNGGAPVDVFQLTTASDVFDYRFPLYGRYEIEVAGEVQDANGNPYRGGGRYIVFVAERLDLEPAILPMTPLQTGDALNPGLTLLPGVPADVEVSVALFRDSDPRRIERWSCSGRANRFGVFTAKAGSRLPVMTGPGEFVVESTARYVDARGVLWMGASRWGQVVETPGSPMLARGRRGRIRMADPPASLWFFSSRARDGGHLRFPYASGDVAWQDGDDSMIPAVTVQDREGLVTKTLRRVFAGDVDARVTLQREGDFEDRIRADELPLPLVSSGVLAATADPRGIRVHGYFYAGAQRPGERVREIVSDDQGVQQHGYWFFKEPYAMQAGIGEQGDLADDFKFLFGGAVLRDDDAGYGRYGIYGALWVRLPDGDPRGGRVFPPFQGAHGGPDGGPLMTLGGEEIDGFVVPLAARPGTILEAGDTFSFSASAAPPLPAQLEVVVTGPGGFRRRISGRANAVGYFYRPDQDFRVPRPGLYRVSVTASFDMETSAGPPAPPFPTGTVLGAEGGSFEVYVVERGSPALRASLPPWSAVRGSGPVALPVELPGGGRGTLHYTIGMPGFLLKAGSLPLEGGGATVSYAPRLLHGRFPNIDIGAPGDDGDDAGSLADTVWVTMMAEGEDGRRYARQFTLQGPDLYAP